MASQIELESLIIRMSADVEGLIKEMERAKGEVDGVTTSIIDNATKIEKSLSGIGKNTTAGDAAKEMDDLGAATNEAAKETTHFGESTNNLTTALSAGLMPAFDNVKRIVLAVTGAYVALRAQMAIIKDFEEQETAERLLNATLKANGREVEMLSQRYANFSTELEKISTTADEVTIRLLKQAESFGLTEDAAEKATKQSLALAAINGTSADAMMRITAAMAAGDIKKAMMFSRLIPQLRGVKDETEYLDKYNKLVSAGFEVMGKEINTAGGAMKQMVNTWSNFREGIGESMSPLFARLARALKSVGEAVSQLPSWLKMVVISIAAVLVVLRVWATLTVQLTTAIATSTVAIKAQTAAALANPYTWIIAAAAAIYLYAENAAKGSKATTDLEESILSLQRTRVKWSEMYVEDTDKMIKKANDDPNKIMAEQEKLANEMHKQQLKIKQDKADVSKAMREDLLYHNPGKDFDRFVRRQFGAEYGRVEKEALKTSYQEYADMTTRKIALEKEFQKAKKGGDAQEKFTELHYSLNEELKMLKKTTHELEVYNSTKLGIPLGQATYLADLKAEIDVGKAYDRNTASVKAFIAEKKKEIDLFGLTGSDRFIMERYKDKSITFEEIEKIRNYTAELKKLAEEEKEVAKIGNLADSIIEKFRSPAEVMAEKIDDLNMAFYSSEMTMETYEMALKDITKELNRMEGAAISAQNALGAGSAEGMAQIIAFSQGVMSPTSDRVRFINQQPKPVPVPEVNPVPQIPKDRRGEAGFPPKPIPSVDRSGEAGFPPRESVKLEVKIENTLAMIEKNTRIQFEAAGIS